jgi:hypothetical protein
MKRLVIALVLLCAVGCKQPKTLPPGALNTFDANSYDTLMTTKAVLATLKVDEPQISAQVPEFKAILNQAISDYDAAETSWQLYHAGAGTATSVSTSLASLAADILKINGLIPKGGK